MRLLLEKGRSMLLADRARMPTARSVFSGIASAASRSLSTAGELYARPSACNCNFLQSGHALREADNFGSYCTARRR